MTGAGPGAWAPGTALEPWARAQALGTGHSAMGPRPQAQGPRTRALGPGHRRPGRSRSLQAAFGRIGLESRTYVHIYTSVHINTGENLVCRQVLLENSLKSWKAGWLGGSSPDFHTPKL